MCVCDIVLYYWICALSFCSNLGVFIWLPPCYKVPSSSLIFFCAMFKLLVHYVVIGKDNLVQP